MDITQLRYFLRTAASLNYTRAAEGLYISRQALRQVLGNLEKELGQKLFRNDRNRLTLTEYGEYLLLASRELVEKFDEMEQNVKVFFREPVTLRLVFSESLFPFQLRGLDGLLAQFRAAHPHVSLKLEFLPSSEVADAAESGEADLCCLLRMPVPVPGCTRVSLRASPIGVSLGPEMPFYNAPVLTLRQLAALPLIAPGPLEKIARPLWEESLRRGIALNCRCVPNAIDALYHVQNSLAAALNTLPSFSASESMTAKPAALEVRTRLEDYTWDVDALCPQGRPNYPMAELLAGFLARQFTQLSARLPGQEALAL